MSDPPIHLPLDPRVLTTGWCTSKDVEPLRGWTRGGVPARTLRSEGGGGIRGSHIAEEEWIVRFTSVGEENKTFFINV